MVFKNKKALKANLDGFISLKNKFCNMKKFILSLAIVATSFGAFAVQTPAPAKKVEVKVDKKAEHKAKKAAKKAAEKKEVAKEAAKAPNPKKG